MTIVAFALVVLVLVILGCWAVDQVPGGLPPYGNIIKLIVIVVGVLAIANRAGLL